LHAALFFGILLKKDALVVQIAAKKNGIPIQILIMKQ
jgi:hypothetical protein